MNTTTGRRLTRPTETLDREIGVSTPFEWQGGDYLATTEKVTLKEIPTNQHGEPFKGFRTDNGEVLGFQFGQLVPMDDQADPGNRKILDDITIADGGDDIFTVTDDESEAWQLRNGANLIYQLAHALGEEPTDEFVEELRQGRVSSEKLIVTIQPYNTKKGSNAGTQVTKFSAA